MNNLTKEELQNLRACLDVCIADDGADDTLMDKLQFMINNYDVEWCKNKNCRLSAHPSNVACIE